MEDATISGVDNQSGVSLLTTDDLVMEIGKLHIENLNNSKIIESLVSTNKKIKADLLAKPSGIAELESKLNISETRVKKVQESSKLLVDHNRELDKAISGIRTELREKEAQYKQELASIVGKHKKAIEKLKESKKPIKKRTKTTKK